MKIRKRKPLSQEKIQDIAWSKAIKERDNGCVIGVDCKGYLNAHHIVPREHRKWRWELDNGLTLCVKHHKFCIKLSAHRNAPSFLAWLHRHRPYVLALAYERSEEVWKE